MLAVLCQLLVLCCVVFPSRLLTYCTKISMSKLQGFFRPFLACFTCGKLEVSGGKGRSKHKKKTRRGQVTEDRSYDWPNEGWEDRQDVGRWIFRGDRAAFTKRRHQTEEMLKAAKIFDSQHRKVIFSTRFLGLLRLFDTAEASLLTGPRSIPGVPLLTKRCSDIQKVLKDENIFVPLHIKKKVYERYLDSSVQQLGLVDSAEASLLTGVCSTSDSRSGWARSLLSIQCQCHIIKFLSITILVYWLRALASC